MELSQYQMFVIGAVASVIVYLVKQIALVFKWKPPKIIMLVVVFLVSVALAVVWSGVVLPVSPVCVELVACVGLWLAWLGEVLGSADGIFVFAVLIYEAILKRVMEGSKATVTTWVSKITDKG